MHCDYNIFWPHNYPQLLRGHSFRFHFCRFRDNPTEESARRTRRDEKERGKEPPAVRQPLAI